MVGFLWRRWPLFALCAGLVLAEAIPLRAVGFDSALPLAPQIAAPAAVGAYHDLRWLFTYSWSWPSLIWQLAALLALRTAITVAVVRLAWPAHRRAVPLTRLAVRTLVATALAVVVLSPWAAIAFAAQAIGFSWFMLYSILATVVTAAVLPVGPTRRWWWRPRWRVAGWVVVAWLVSTAAALAVSVSPSWVAVLTAGCAGLANAVIWLRLVGAAVRAPVPARWRAGGPLAVVAVLAVFLVAGGYPVTGVVRRQLHPPAGSSASAASPAPRPGEVPVLFVAGFTSSYAGGADPLFADPRLPSWHFSYRGLGPDGPLPYDASWTRESIEASAAKLAAQLDWLAAREGRPVALIAESEGTLVTRAYLAEHPDPPVRYYVMASPLPRPAWVYYPPAGRTGFGMAAAWEVRGLLSLAQLQAPDLATLGVDMPFARSVVERAALFRPDMLCPVAGPRTVAFLPLASATVVYSGPVSHVPWTAEPGFHDSLLSRGTTEHDIERLLATGVLAPHGKSTVGFRMIYGAAAGWQVPALPLRLRPQWLATPGTDPAFAGWRCAR